MFLTLELSEMSSLTGGTPRLGGGAPLPRSLGSSQKIVNKRDQ